MQQYGDLAFFTDHTILKDPYNYLESLRPRGPVFWLDAGKTILAVIGYSEAVEVLGNAKDFSSSIAVQGPAAPLAYVPAGGDITDQIETHRKDMFGSELLVALDDQRHANSRAIMNRLFTPSRLKANAEFVTECAENSVDAMVAKGRCELVKEVATPFVTLVIADLLGVPAADRQLFMDAIDAAPPPGSLDGGDSPTSGGAMAERAQYFARYIMQRRAQPADDILSELANATFPDGELPEVAEIVRLASFLFGAGQDTSAKLLGNAIRYIVDVPGLQDQLRADPSLIPDVIEEVLRLEGSTKMTSRIARRDTTLAGFDVPSGTKVFIAFAAANRDPRRWENPSEFILGRPKIKEHLAFGRGSHVCAGAPLARSEVRIILEKFLEKTSRIELDESVHGPAGSREFDFEPSFIIRGLSALEVVLHA